MFRKMIPPLVDAGYRVIVPDFIGKFKKKYMTRDACFLFFWFIHSLLMFNFLVKTPVEVTSHKIHL